ncbi:hypothetical protein H5U56_07170, partial [Escherichia coli]|nr:hypothetical protein [Escherichia coli]
MKTIEVDDELYSYI